MSPLEQTAIQLLETAGAAARLGEEVSDWSVLVSPHGHITVLNGAAWSLAALAQEHGARAVYKVSRRAGCIRVEGRSGSRTCVIEERRTPPCPPSPAQREWKRVLDVPHFEGLVQHDAHDVKAYRGSRRTLPAGEYSGGRYQAAALLPVDGAHRIAELA